jgi:hypothetical protein
MAQVRANDLVEGLSGAFGPMVFKQYNGKTVVCRRGRKPTKESEHQRKNRDRFRKATLYAQHAMTIPERKVYYQRKAKKLKLPNAYTAAITDYMRKPRIAEVTKNENLVRVAASKRNFALANVKVLCFNKTGDRTLEEDASLSKDGYWMLKIPAFIDVDQLAIIAQDYPGNVIHQTIHI